MKKVIFVTLFWLVVVNIFALLAVNRLNLKGDTAYTWIDPAAYVQGQSWNPVSFHARWDSVFYTDIARHGYHLTPGSTLSNIVFFPLYPLLIFLVLPLVGGHAVLAGWLISMAALVGVAAVFYKLLREFHPSVDPELPLWYLLIFPTAFFLNTVYTESLFLLLSLLTFYYALKGRFTAAGIFGLLAALTRVTGVLLFIPVVWEFFMQRGKRNIASPAFLPTLLIPLGTFLFFLYHKVVFGDFFLFLKVESAWGRGFTLNTSHFLLHSSAATVTLLLDVLLVVFALFATYRVFRQKWVSYGLYMLATIGVALSTGTLMSVGRYVLVLFPMYITLATVKSKYFNNIYMLASVLLLALNITLFVNGYWTG